MATDELKNIIAGLPVASVPADVLLTSLAVQFNNRLLGYKKFKDTSYQCCAAFAAIKEGVLYYLTVGDCRISVRRDDNLILLNGSVWAAGAGGSLPPLVKPQQETKRSNELDPQFVLGVGEVTIQPMQVQEFRLDRDDAVLLYSDGVDKILSPAQVLALVSDGIGRVSPEEIVWNVLNEVGAHQGDDDRTLLIAVGPHEQAGEEMLKSVVDLIESEQNRQAQLLQTLIQQQKEYLDLAQSVGERLRDLDKLGSLEESLAYMKEVYTLSRSIESALKAVPRIGNIESVITSAMRAQNDDRVQIARLGTQLTDIQKHLSAYGGGGGDAEKVPIIRRPPKDNDRPEETQTKTRRPGPERASVDEDLGLCYFREGVIRVSRGRYELIDEEDVTERSGNAPTVYMYPTGGSRPGSLTALHLYLRTLEQQPKDSTGAAQVRDWIKVQEIDERVGQKLAQLNDNQLISGREWHWRNVRDYRRSNNPRQYKEVVASERDYACLFFSGTAGTDGKETSEGALADGNKAASVSRTQAWLGEDGAYSRYLTPRNLIIASVLAALTLFIVSLYFALRDPEQQLLPNLNANSNTNQSVPPRPPGGRFGLTVGADGRTLYVLDEGREPRRLGLFVEPVNASGFSGIFPEAGADDVPELLKGFATKAEEMELRIVPSISPPKDTRLFEVEQGDMKSRDICNNFKIRVDQKLPKDVKTNLEALKKLNPGLDCNNLKAGDSLIVNNTVWANQ